jgi:enoyl-CoA hydratase
MTPELTTEFPRAIAAVRADDDIRALILTNTGSTFCAGGDLRTLEIQTAWSAERNRRFMSDFYRAYLSVLSLDVPTIAVLGGHAIGAGMSMTLGCDLRFAAENARFGFTYLNLGLHPGMGTSHLLPMVVGAGVAADLMLTCRLVGAPEALQMGLVSRVYPAERLLEESLGVAREVAKRSPSGVRMAKRALAQRKLAGLEAALDYEATAQMGSFASDEMKTALAALRKNS